MQLVSTIYGPTTHQYSTLVLENLLPFFFCSECPPSRWTFEKEQSHRVSIWRHFDRPERHVCTNPCLALSIRFARRRLQDHGAAHFFNFKRRLCQSLQESDSHHTHAPSSPRAATQLMSCIPTESCTERFDSDCSRENGSVVILISPETLMPYTSFLLRYCMLRPHHTAKQHTSIGLSIPDQGDINNVARLLFVRNWDWLYS